MWSRLKRWWAGAGARAVAVLGAARRSFLDHRARRFGAGLAYYALFALIPTMFLALTIVAALFGTEATEGRLVDRLDGIVGDEAAQQIEEAVASLWENTNTSGFAIVTLAVVVYSASILFVAWRDTLEDIWELPYRSGLETTIRSRVYGALVPLGAGILLSAIVIVELLAALAGEFITAPLLDAIIRAVEMISPTVVSVLALGLVYRVSTRLRPRWRDIWPGTIVAADGELPIVNDTGGSALSTAGTGDVLTGVVSALLARGLAPRHAAAMGVALHGLAGEVCLHGDGSIAGDIADALPAARSGPGG